MGRPARSTQCSTKDRTPPRNRHDDRTGTRRRHTIRRHRPPTDRTGRRIQPRPTTRPRPPASGPGDGPDGEPDRRTTMTIARPRRRRDNKRPAEGAAGSPLLPVVAAGSRPRAANPFPDETGARCALFFCEPPRSAEDHRDAIATRASPPSHSGTPGAAAGAPSWRRARRCSRRAADAVAGPVGDDPVEAAQHPRHFLHGLDSASI